MRADASRRTLFGRTVVTTREQRGELDRLLARLGADVVHVPLIETTDPADGGAALAGALSRIGEFDWVVVTSRVGAARVGPALRDTRLHIAAVGSRTAEAVAEHAGRPPDVVPSRQTALDLAGALPAPPAGGARLLIAQADRADPAHAAAIADRGYEVTAVTAYRTALRTPTASERRAALGADVLTLASGSAAEAWSASIGAAAPPVVVAIGPSTATAADDAGIKITHVAADHSIEGLVAAVVRAVGSESYDRGTSGPAEDRE